MAAALRGVDAVIHSAGLAHAMSGMPEDDYRAINTRGDAQRSPAPPSGRGVKRFVFLSSIRAQTGPAAGGVLTEGGRAAADRRLWPLEARSRAGPAPALGLDWVGAAPGARLRRRA